MQILKTDREFRLNLNLYPFLRPKNIIRNIDDTNYEPLQDH